MSQVILFLFLSLKAHWLLVHAAIFQGAEVSVSVMKLNVCCSHRWWLAQNIVWTDVFIVILDVDITKEITNSEQKNHIDYYEDKGEQADLRKLFIPVKWSWSRVQKVCGKSAKQHIMATLANEAKQQRHNCWMNKYKECETLGMKPTDNRKIIIISEAEVFRCFKEPSDKVVQWHLFTIKSADFKLFCHCAGCVLTFKRFFINKSYFYWCMELFW